MGLLRLLFSFQGRIGRLRHLGGNLIIWLVGGGVLLWAWQTVLSPFWQAGDDMKVPLGNLAALAVVIALFVVLTCWATLALTAKRLHDMDMSGWHLLWMIALSSLAPNLDPATAELSIGTVLKVAGFLAWAWVFVVPGTRGPNRYGPAPGAAPPAPAGGARLPWR